MTDGEEHLVADGQFDFSQGVDSGRVTTLESELNPLGLKRTQLAWMLNATCRGGGITQRTGWQPVVQDVAAAGLLFQGGFIYSPNYTNPYAILSVAGRIIKVMLEAPYTVTDLSAVFGLVNPATPPESYFCQAEEFLIIQAGDFGMTPTPTLPLFWDGTTLRRSTGITGPLGGELPAATAMDYFMGRLWYAIGREYCAGDIVGGASGTLPYNFRDAVLKVSENPLAIGGDGFTVPTSAGLIRALKHTANLDTALGQGELYIFTRKVIYALNVPVTRAEWLTSEEPLQRVAQLVNGSYGDRCIAASNGDLFYQAPDGIRSFQVSVRFFKQWGNIAISSNVQRILDFNDRALMRLSSGIQFDNRLLQTALPVQTDSGVVFQAIVPLDFDIISSLQEQKPPAWEGHYEGLDHYQLLEGDFGGLQRAFSVVRSRETGAMQIWELTDSYRTDNGDTRVAWYVETPAYTWAAAGYERKLKELAGGEIWIDKIFGSVDFQIEYRVDSDPCWRYWHREQLCAARSSCEDVNNPVCYPEQPYRESYKIPVILPTPPFPDCQYPNKRPVNIGYQFQVKITIKGWCRIRGLILYALPRDRQPYEGLTY